MQTLLFILNDGPYGSEKTFNALRLALNIKEQYEQDVVIKLFLMSDAVTSALLNQRPVEGYNIEQMLEILLAQGAELKLCKTCTDARGVTELPLIEGAQISTLIELSQWTFEADKVLTF
ncbi:MAG TPA: DsrE/DsrF/TusD sulfur relay family protein [Psychromonas sp.]